MTHWPDPFEHHLLPLTCDNTVNPSWVEAYHAMMVCLLQGTWTATAASTCSDEAPWSSCVIGVAQGNLEEVRAGGGCTWELTLEVDAINTLSSRSSSRWPLAVEVGAESKGNEMKKKCCVLVCTRPGWLMMAVDAEDGGVPWWGSSLVEVGLMLLWGWCGGKCREIVVLSILLFFVDVLGF